MAMRNRRGTAGMRRVEVKLPPELVIEIDVIAAKSAKSRVLVIEDLLLAGLASVGAKP